MIVRNADGRQVAAARTNRENPHGFTLEPGSYTAEVRARALEGRPSKTLCFEVGGETSGMMTADFA